MMPRFARRNISRDFVGKQRTRGLIILFITARSLDVAALAASFRRLPMRGPMGDSYIGGCRGAAWARSSRPLSPQARFGGRARCRFEPPANIFPRHYARLARGLLAMASAMVDARPADLRRRLDDYSCRLP